MQLPSEPTEVVFESTGKNLKLSSVSKVPFNLKDEGKLEVLKSKIKGNFSVRVSNSMKKRSFKFDSTFEHKFIQIYERFTLNLKSRSKESTILSGELFTLDSVKELKDCIENLFTRKIEQSSPYKSKDILRNGPVVQQNFNNLPNQSYIEYSASTKDKGAFSASPLPLWKSKETLNSPGVNKKLDNLHKPSLDEDLVFGANLKENASRSTLKRKLIKPSCSVNRQPLAILQSNHKKTTPSGKSTSSFYINKIPKFMPPPQQSSNEKMKPKSLFPNFFRKAFKYRFGNKNYANKELSPHAEKVVGFTNLGNTCYMNAILQCLLNIPNFYQELRNRNNTDLVASESLYNRLGKLGTVKHTQEQEETQRKCLQKVKESISSAARVS